MAENIKSIIDSFAQVLPPNENGTIHITDETRKQIFDIWGLELWIMQKLSAREVRKALEYANNKYFVPSFNAAEFDSSCFKLFAKNRENSPEVWNNDFPFVFAASNKWGEHEFKVDFKLLAEHVKQKGHYYFVNGNVYLYNSDLSIYEAVSNEKFRGYIMSFVNALSCTLAKTNGIDGALKDIKSDSEHSVIYDDFNADWNLINFQNGVLRLNTMELTPHSPDILSTIQIPCNWNIDNQPPACPVFDKYLKDLSSGNEEIIRFLWQFIGFTISNIPGYITKQALFIYGEHNTGKSKIFALLEKLLGDSNSTVTELADLEGDFGTYPLLNKRLAGSPDMSYMKVTELKIFKQLTGGDSIQFKEKYKSPFKGKYKGVLLFCGNKMPLFGGDKGEATYSRMIIIKCTNVLPKDKQDKIIVEKMFAEKEAIVYRAVQAVKQFIKNGYRFDIPSVCEIETQKFKIMNDNVMQFLDECTMLRQAQYTNYRDCCTTANMYTAYTHWLTENGERYQTSKSEFIKTACQFYNFKDVENIKHKYNGNWFFKFTIKPSCRHLIGFPDSTNEEEQIKAI